MPILSYFQISITTIWTAWLLYCLNLTIIVAYCLYILRLWLIFFSVMKNYECIKNKWQSIIDPTSCAKSWYCQNKTRYGSWTGLKKYFIPFLIGNFLVQFWMMYCMIYLHDTSLRWLQYIPFGLALLKTYLPLGALFYAFRTLPFYQDSIGLFTNCTIYIYILCISL